MKIDHIFIITLPHRTDRLDRLTNQLKSFNLEYEVFYGVNGKKIKTKYECDNMNNGCTASHGQVLQRAQIYGIDNCLVLEDDCVLSDNFVEEIEKLELPTNYDVCYLSGTHRELPIKINDTISRCVKTLTTHAYIANLNSFILLELSRYLLGNISNSLFCYPVDCYFAEFQVNNFYVLNKPLAWQSGGYSDINQREMYYEHLKQPIHEL